LEFGNKPRKNEGVGHVVVPFHKRLDMLHSVLIARDPHSTTASCCKVPRGRLQLPCRRNLVLLPHHNPAKPEASDHHKERSDPHQTKQQQPERQRKTKH
jgi:hypothetical protein